MPTIITLLDTGLRISELCHLKMEKLWLEDGLAKVLGKGNKERMIPIGKQTQRVLWHYIDLLLSEPNASRYDFVFLTQTGRPITTRRMEAMMTIYS